MSILRAAAWRKHPLLQYGPQHMLIGLPTGIAMFIGVTIAEKTGVLTWDKDANPRKYDFVSAVYGAPPKDDAHGSDHGKAGH